MVRLGVSNKKNVIEENDLRRDLNIQPIKQG